MSGRTRSGAFPAASASATQLTALMIGVPFVVTARLGRLWFDAAAPGTPDPVELARMVTEKAQAMVESAIAVNLAMTRITMDAAAAAVRGRIRNSQRDADVLLSAALRPYATRVTANRKRLSH